MTDNLNFDTSGFYRIPIFYFGEVVSVEDPTETGRIKIYIEGLDNITLKQNPNLTDTEGNQILPFALPVLPKHLSVHPEIGERVLVIVQYATLGNQSSNSQTRFWIGPRTSQPQRIGGQDFKSSEAELDSGTISLEPSLKTKPASSWVYPKKKYISIQGRDNSDLIFKKQEIVLRTGKSVPGKQNEFNKIDPAYIQIKYLSKNDDNVTTETKTLGSNINVVGNYINLLSHKGNSFGDFTLTNQPKNNSNDDQLYITNKDQSIINTKTHPVPFGDILVQFLKLVQNYATQHVHPYNGMVSDPGDALTKLLNFDLNSILNNNVRTN